MCEVPSILPIRETDIAHESFDYLLTPEEKPPTKRISPFARDCSTIPICRSLRRRKRLLRVKAYRDNLVFPSTLARELLREILDSVEQKAAERRAVVIGGHKNRWNITGEEILK